MSRIVVTRTIAAPIDLVFNTVANINQFSKAVPRIVKYEFLSDVKSGVGTRFRETRLMKGQEATTELEVTEYIANDHVRIVADSHGTVWDTVFTVKLEKSHTELTVAMDAKAYKLAPKIINPLISHVIKNAMEQDMDAVKAFCEK
jgi:hypothetical protein